LCTTVHVDMRTFARKRLGDRKPDPRRRSRHQRDFPSKSQIHFILRYKTRALLIHNPRQMVLGMLVQIVRMPVETTGYPQEA
jgi:hypothetical protein